MRLLLASFLFLAGCGPPLVWGTDETVRNRVLAIVPIGSTVGALENEAGSRNWRIRVRDDRPFRRGLAHYYGGACRHRGGISETIVIAEYGLLTTTVETVWMFDEAGTLRDVCVRRTTDGP